MFHYSTSNAVYQVSLFLADEIIEKYNDENNLYQP